MAFPHYRQYDSMDCGPTCLQIIASFYGKFFTLSKLRELCYVNREGVSMLGVSDAVIYLGFRTVGVKISIEDLINKAVLPCIVHFNNSHYVVVYRANKKKIYVSDPARGRDKYSIEEFCNLWLKQLDPFVDIYFEKIVKFLNFNSRYTSCGMYKQHLSFEEVNTEIENKSLYAPLIMCSMLNASFIGNCLDAREDLERAINDFSHGRFNINIDSIYSQTDYLDFLNKTFSPDKQGKVVLKYV